MNLVRFTLPLLLVSAAASAALADAVPTLNDILNASQLDVRSSATLPKPSNAEVAEVRADAPLRQTFRTGPNVTRLAKIAIWFSGWSPSWTPQKSLVMRLYAGQDFAHVLAEADEPYSRRLWEGGVHVFTLNAAVSQNAEYTFELTVRGGRELVGAALAEPAVGPALGEPTAGVRAGAPLPAGAGAVAEPPAGAALAEKPVGAALTERRAGAGALAVPSVGVGVGPLVRGGELLSGSLWFETIVKRRSDLDKLYLDVFNHFDLQRSDMRAVRDAVAARDWERAKRALVAHFEGRRDLFPVDANRTGAAGASQTAQLADADLVVQHKFRAADQIVDLGPRWNHMAAWSSRGGVGLTRSGLRGILATAYTRTHDERYARAWDAMLRFQFEDLPSPLRAGVIPLGAVGIAPIGEPGIGGGSMWASLSIGARMMHGFAYYRAFRGSPSFLMDTRFAFIANLAEMSDVLEKMKGGGNWEAQNTTALLEFGTTFPEFHRAPVWQARGFAGALQSCLENTFPDGALREATTNYHSLSLNRYLGVLESARRRPLPGLIVPQQVRERVEKMCDYLLYSTMPNGQLPRWGDSNLPLDAAGLLLRGADYFSRPDMRWVATRGKTGTLPPIASTAFPDAGYYLMRSGWNPNAAFLALHNGHSSAHGHSDSNSFVLTAFGNELLIDPGVFIYGTPESQLLTRTVSHNTVTMDDLNTVNDRGDARFIAGWWTDLFDGSNAGYQGARRDGDARHRRIVLFLKPALFFVVDTAQGQQPHDWTLRDHFAPGRLDAASDGKSLTFLPTADSAYARTGRGGLLVWSAPRDGTVLTVAPGLASGGWERKIEAPVAIWSQFHTTTACWASLLEPFASRPPGPGWDVRQDDHGTALAFQKDGRTRRYLLVRPDGEAALPDSWVESTGFSTDAETAAYEERPSQAGGTFRRLALHSGTLFLQPAADVPALVRAEKPASLLEITWQGDTITVHRVGGEGITVRTFGARWLVVNGRRHALAGGQATCRLPDTAASARGAVPR